MPTTGKTLPEIYPQRGSFEALVVENVLLCREHYRLTVRTPEFPASYPGNFVQILADKKPGAGENDCELRELEWQLGRPAPKFREPFFLGSRPYLRRPFSIAGRRDATDANGRPYADLDIIYRVIGKTTQAMQKLKTGDAMDLLGPMGNSFELPGPTGLALLVGGGVGIPPMIYLAEFLALAGIQAVTFMGAQSADLVSLTFPPSAPKPSAEPNPLPCAQEFARHGISSIITTDDGSMGVKGFVTAALRDWLQKKRTSLPPETIVFCCGPTPMMRATGDVAAAFNLRCQASLEQPMACGMGTCQSCVIKFRPAGWKDWVYKLTCTDGPVFDTADILWE
ncbi:MAG TPA: dihydroorotate dehydrogenase electron transfer subunit [Phycisphaerae bacterium]|nr:dihydroorotate dehydrogenase electron transfer subunit [Phycisphaerae bacterium]